MKTSTYLCLVFLCISRLPRSLFLVGVCPVGAVIHCNCLYAGVVFVVH